MMHKKRFNWRKGIKFFIPLVLLELLVGIYLFLIPMFANNNQEYYDFLMSNTVQWGAWEFTYLDVNNLLYIFIAFYIIVGSFICLWKILYKCCLNCFEEVD